MQAHPPALVEVLVDEILEGFGGRDEAVIDVHDRTFLAHLIDELL